MKLKLLFQQYLKNCFLGHFCLKSIFKVLLLKLFLQHVDFQLKDFKPLFLRIQSKCGKIRTRITPNTDTFYAVPISKTVADRSFFYKEWELAKVQMRY